MEGSFCECAQPMGRHYILTSCFIGWVHIQNDSWIWYIYVSNVLMCHIKTRLLYQEKYFNSWFGLILWTRSIAVPVPCLNLLLFDMGFLAWLLINWWQPCNSTWKRCENSYQITWPLRWSFLESADLRLLMNNIEISGVYLPMVG